MARRVADLRLALGALSTPLQDATRMQDIRVGVYEDDGYLPASPAVRRAVREATAELKRQGPSVVDFVPPDIHEALDIFYGLFGAMAAPSGRRS